MIEKVAAKNINRHVWMASRKTPFKTVSVLTSASNTLQTF